MNLGSVDRIFTAHEHGLCVPGFTSELQLVSVGLQFHVFVVLSPLPTVHLRRHYVFRLSDSQPFVRPLFVR